MRIGRGVNENGSFCKKKHINMISHPIHRVRAADDFRLSIYTSIYAHI